MTQSYKIGVMANYLTNLVGAFAVGCSDLQDAAMAAIGHDQAELTVLLFVYTRPGATIRDIQRTAAMTHSGVVRTVDRLSAASRIERRTGEDRRTVTLYCTRDGEAAARAALAARASSLDGLIAGLTGRERRALENVILKLLTKLPGDRHAARRLCRFCDHETCKSETCPVDAAATKGEKS